MKIVVDANIVIAILTLPYSGQVTHKMLKRKMPMLDSALTLLNMS